MIWRTYFKGGSSQKYYISGQLWNKKPVRLPGFRDEQQTKDLMANIESLNRSKRFGRLPDESLAPWIAGLPPDQAARYIELGLLDGSLRDNRRPLDDLLAKYLDHLKANNRRASQHPKSSITRIRRLISALGEGITFEDLTKDEIVKKLNEMLVVRGKRKGKPLSQKSRRETLLAMKAFCNWMVAKNRLLRNPIFDVKAPSAKGDPVHNRRPMPLEDFTKLMEYMRHAPLKSLNGQPCKWKPKDRMLTYWMAVLTGFRAKELKSLTPASLDFDVSPATVTIEGHNAKNGNKATLPLDSDLAVALREFSRDKAPTDPLLNMLGLGKVTLWFYRDMDSAGIRRRFADGSLIDFHALRSTAICWWLNINGLMPLEVRERARLQSLDLVQQYSKRFQPKHEDLLRNGPKIMDPNSLFKSFG